MQAVIKNISGSPRQRWARCNLPYLAAADLGDEAVFVASDGRRFRAVRGANVGTEETCYRVFASLNGSERIVGEVQRAVLARAADLQDLPKVTLDDAIAERVAPSAAPLPPMFVPHPWVSDDILALVPDIIIEKDGRRFRCDPSVSYERVDKSAAHERWHVKRFLWVEWSESGNTRRTRFEFEFIAEICHLDPVVECWGWVVWSDRGVPETDFYIDGIALVTGEFFRAFWRKRLGIMEPLRITNPATGRLEYVTVLAGKIGFSDATGLPIAGEMLCFVGPTNAALPLDSDPEIGTDWVSESLRSLVAASDGLPVRASCVDRDGAYLAAKNPPRLDPSVDAAALADTDWHRFMDLLQSSGTYYDLRPLGCSFTPGQTGDQEDFAAIKGTHIVTGKRPEWIWAMEYSIYVELFRGIFYYENGVPLDPTKHPQWITWSGRTHYHPGVSRDRLGKADTVWGAFTATAWRGYDDQHRSQNNLAAVRALDDNPLVDAIIKFQSIPDAAMLLNRVGATRAVGRLSGAWSQFVLLLNPCIERTRFANRIVEKLQAVMNFSDLNVAGPVKVIAHGDPDGRKNIRDPNTGALLPWWSAWEHGLFTVGAYNMWKATGDSRWLDMLKTVCTSVVRYALWQEGGQWFLADDLWYRAGGEAIPAEDQNTASSYFVVTPGIGGTTLWAFNAVLIGAEILSDDDQRKAKEAVRFFTGGREATDRRIAEWWACVRSIVELSSTTMPA